MLPFKFLQCQRCERLILSETSTAKRIHNVKCLSFTMNNSKIGKQTNSEIFQGFVNMFFPGLSINVQRLNNEEIRRACEDIKNKTNVDKTKRGRGGKEKSSGAVDFENDNSRRPRLSCLKAKTKFKTLTDSEGEDNEIQIARTSNKDRRRKKLRKKREVDEDPTVNIKHCRQQLESPQKRKNKGRRRVMDKVPCPKCNKVLAYAALGPHMKRHEIFKKPVARNVKCEICQNYYSSTYALKTHFISAHLEKTPFVCKFSGCNYKGGEYYHLERHVGTHLKENRIKCRYCGKHIVGRYVPRHVCAAVARQNDDNVPALRNKHVMSKNFTNEDGPSNTEVKTETSHIIQMDSIHLFDKIIETQEGPIHIKGERLEIFPEVATATTEIIRNSNHSSSSHVIQETSDVEWDEGKLREAVTKKIFSWNSRLKDNDYINSAIKDDPLFQQLEKENPQFANMVLPDRDRKNYFWMHKAETKCLFRCDICARAFRRSWALQNHKEKNVCQLQKGNDVNISGSSSETGITVKHDTSTTKCTADNDKNHHHELNFMCGGCGFQTTSAQELELHMRNSPLHRDRRKNKRNKSKIYRCPKHCNATFTTGQQLHQHIIEIHTTTPTFKCDKCDKKFVNDDILKKHVYTYHDRAKVYSCSKCELKFADKVRSEKHERHCKPEISRPKCHKCGEQFCHVQSLTRHVRLVHGSRKKSTDKNARISENGIMDVNSSPNKVAVETNEESVKRGDDMNSMILGL